MAAVVEACNVPGALRLCKIARQLIDGGDLPDPPERPQKGKGGGKDGKDDGERGERSLAWETDAGRGLPSTTCPSMPAKAKTAMGTGIMTETATANPAATTCV